MQSAGGAELKVVPASTDCSDPSRLRVCLSDVEDLVYKDAAPPSLRRVLHGDPLARIQQAGCVDYSYEKVASKEHGLMTVADLFGVCLYLATLPRSKSEIRSRVLKMVCKVLHAPEEATLHSMEQVGWDLALLHSKLDGACEFSDLLTDPTEYPANKAVNFPLHFYQQTGFRQLYEHASQQFFAKYPPGNKSLTLVSFPNHQDKRSWLCPKLGCSEEAAMPSDMVNHLAEHPEYRGFAVQLGVARLLANRQSVGVRRMKFEVPAVPSQKRSSCSDASGKKRSRDSSSKLDQQLICTQGSSATDKVLTLMHKQNDSMLNRLDRMLTSQEEKDSQMSRMLALQEKKDAQMQQLLDLVVKQSTVIETQTKTVGTIAETEEAAKRLATWKQMQQGDT